MTAAMPTTPAAPRSPADRGRTTTIAGLCIAGGGLLVGLIFGLAVSGDDEDDPAQVLRRYAAEQRKMRATDLGLPGYTPDPDTDYPPDRFVLPAPFADDVAVATLDDDDPAPVLRDESDLGPLGRMAGNDDDEDDDDHPLDKDYDYDLEPDLDGLGDDPGGGVPGGVPNGAAMTLDPSVSMGDVTAPAGADLGEITARLHGTLADLRACYQRALGDQPDLAGTVDVTLLVGKSGTVLHDAAVTGSAELRTCVDLVNRGLHFRPAPSPYQISYPLVFAPS